MFVSPQDYKTSIFPGFDYPGNLNGTLQSVVHTSVRLNNLNPQNFGSNIVGESEIANGAILVYMRRFPRRFSKIDLEIINYTNLTTIPRQS